MINSLFQIAAAASLAGPGGAEGAERPRYVGSGDSIEVATPAVESAALDIDGRLDEVVWQEAALLEGFTQFSPIEGASASQGTQVLVFVDRDAIYFAVHAHADDPSAIRATLTERDSYTFSDDYVRLILDTFDDQRRAYVFTVNPLGVQHDGLWNETGGTASSRGGWGPPIDDNPDFLWDSEGRITDEGYQVEVRIPFKSLRFPDSEEQAWGLQVERNIQRTGFQSSWAPITQNVANRLSQMGRLTGLTNLDRGVLLELNPVLTGTQIGEYDAGRDGLLREDPRVDFGLNVTYGVASNLGLDATYNPDFSQVEADAGQIQVNERFALFFPEKRPFFLEGTEIFGMAKQLVYTRTIANPIGGAKLTGKVGSLSVGYLGAVDESFDVGGPKTVVNLLRIRQDVTASSTLGAIYTDRTVSTREFNRVAGADARLEIDGRYTLTLMGAASFTNTPALAEAATGTLVHTKFERAGRSFTFNAELEDTDRDFNASSGFFQRIGDTQIRSRVEYTWFGSPGGLLEQLGPSLDFTGYWDHDDFWAGDGLEEGQVQLGWNSRFRGNLWFSGNVMRSMFSYAPESYEGLFVEQPGGAYTAFRPSQNLFGGLDGVTFSLWVNNWERVRGNVRYTFSDAPIFDRRFGVAVEPADSYSGELTVSLYPTRALVAEIGVRQTRLIRQRDGVEHSSAIITRIRTQYQFSRAIFLRGIFEYSSQEVSALEDPATGLPLSSCDASGCAARASGDRYDFHLEGLISYEPSPGTTFFVGYTRQMEDTDAFRFRNVRATADGLFVKLSYRFRM